jgi:hypothetical protein
LRGAGAAHARRESWRGSREPEQRTIVLTRQGGVKPGAKFLLRNLPLFYTRQHDRTGEDFSTRVVLSGAAGGEGLFARFATNLAGAELLELGFQ